MASEETFDENAQMNAGEAETEPVADVAGTEEALVDAVYEYAGNDFRMQEEYRNRLEAFFPVRDENNCERTYRILSRMSGGKCQETGAAPQTAAGGIEKDASCAAFRQQYGTCGYRDHADELLPGDGQGLYPV